MNITSHTIDPFLECITIASLCHLIYRKMILKPSTISIIPELGYNPEQIVSIKALQWLKYISFKENAFIKHAKNGGEHAVGAYFLDGLNESTKTIYEFHGCFWHGCQKCYKSDTWNPIKRELMYSTNKRHLSRMKFIKNRGIIFWP